MARNTQPGSFTVVLASTVPDLLEQMRKFSSVRDLGEQWHNLVLRGCDEMDIVRYADRMGQGDPSDQKIANVLAAYELYRSELKIRPSRSGGNTVEKETSVLKDQIDTFVKLLHESIHNPPLDAEGAPIRPDIHKVITSFCELAKLKIKVGGLAAPARKEITVTDTISGSLSMDEEIKALTAQLGLN